MKFEILNQGGGDDDHIIHVTLIASLSLTLLALSIFCNSYCESWKSNTSIARSEKNMNIAIS